MNRVSRMTAALGALAFAGTVAATPSPTTPPTLRIVATANSYRLPKRVPAGLMEVRLVNSDRTLHEGNLVHFITPGSAAAYSESVRAGVDYPANAEDVGGPGIANPGDSTSVWMRLTPGHYAILCFYGAHPESGGYADLEVVPSASSAAPPAADIDVRMLNFGYDIHGGLTAGRHIVHVANRGTEYHEFDPYRLLPGKHAEDFFTWKENHGRGPSPVVPLGGSGSMVPGREVWLPMTLTPGRYVVFCEVKMPNDRKAHYRQGMFREFEVPAAGK